MNDVVERRPIGVTQAVEVLSDVAGKRYRIVQPLAGGETGATEIEDPHGRRYVFKWEVDPDNRMRRLEGARLADRLRAEAGWPAPEQQLLETDACLLILQEFMPGSTVDWLSGELVASLFDLHEQRLGLAVPSDTDLWAKDMIEILVHGGNGYCLHEPLRRFDRRTRRIVHRIEEIGRSLDPSELGGGDVVHSDLHPGNLLQEAGRLTAVIDMDYVRVGDAAFDLVMLALSSLEVGTERGVRSRLFARGIDDLAAPRRNAYVGNFLLRALDWPIRKSRPDEIEFWITQAEHLLPE
jgi:hypothetical protein